MVAPPNFDWIVPINTTAADTKDPGFYLAMYGIVSACLTYLFFSFITGGFKSATNTKEPSTYVLNKVDFGLSVVFGFILFVTMYSYAWGGYINIVLYQYAPGNGTRGLYGLQLPQDIYGITLSSLGLWVGVMTYFYRWTVARLYPDGSVLDVPEKDLKEMKKTNYYKAWFAYAFRYPAMMLGILSWIILPGALAYKQNGALFNAGSWMTLLSTILLGLHASSLMYWQGLFGNAPKLFPVINGLVRKNDGDKSIFIKGFMIGFYTDFTFLLAYFFYVTGSEMMIYGDLIKVTASVFAGFYIPALMAGLTKERAAFFPLHIICKTYFIIFNYWLEYVRTPIPSPMVNSDYIDKNVVDICSFTTGPSYYTMNNYLTSYQLFAGLGFGLSCAVSFVTFMLPSLLNARRPIVSGEVAAVGTPN